MQNSQNTNSLDQEKQNKNGQRSPAASIEKPRSPATSLPQTATLAKQDSILGKRLAKDSGLDQPEMTSTKSAQFLMPSSPQGSRGSAVSKRMNVIEATHGPGQLQTFLGTAHTAEVGQKSLTALASVSATLGLEEAGQISGRRCSQANDRQSAAAVSPSKEPIVPESTLKERRVRPGRPKGSLGAKNRNTTSNEQTPHASDAVTPRKRRVALADADSDDDDDDKKKDKKLVFLSRSVLQKVRERPMVTGTQIANEILEMYKKFCDIGQKVDFKNVQRRVYDALNVLSAMDIIRKDKYNIIYNHHNEHIPSDFGHTDSESEGEAFNAMGSVSDEDQNVPCTLSPQNVQQGEREVQEMRKRIRDKQKLFLELIKQQVSITKLKQRNIEVANQMLNEGDGALNVDRSVAFSSQKLQLPLLFVECQPDSRIKISQDDTKMHLKLSTDRKFALSDENYLFDCMGLTKTTSDELNQMFEPKVIEFLRKSELVQALPLKQAPAAKTEEPVEQSEENPSAHLTSANTQSGGGKYYTQRAPGTSTPITKFLPANKGCTDEQFPAGQLSEPFKAKLAGNQAVAISPDFGGQESLGTQHSTTGSHQLYQPIASKKQAVTGLRV